MVKFAWEFKGVIFGENLGKKPEIIDNSDFFKKIATTDTKYKIATYIREMTGYEFLRKTGFCFEWFC